MSFLGSVRILADNNAHAGEPTNIFVGTITVVDSAPDGQPNPYLGNAILVGSVPESPNLGQVMIVNAAPDGESDPFIGIIAES